MAGSPRRTSQRAVLRRRQPEHVAHRSPVFCHDHERNPVHATLAGLDFPLHNRLLCFLWQAADHATLLDEPFAVSDRGRWTEPVCNVSN